MLASRQKTTCCINVLMCFRYLLYLVWDRAGAKFHKPKSTTICHNRMSTIRLTCHWKLAQAFSHFHTLEEMRQLTVQCDTENLFHCAYINA